MACQEEILELVVWNLMMKVTKECSRESIFSKEMKVDKVEAMILWNTMKATRQSMIVELTLAVMIRFSKSAKLSERKEGQRKANPKHRQ